MSTERHDPLTHIPRDEHDREIEALTVRVGHEVAARDAAQARHDAEIAGIVEELHRASAMNGGLDAFGLPQNTGRVLGRIADSIATTHAAALARHAGRAGGANG